MSLHTVTITGIDQSTDLVAIRDLSARFNFVEWALLSSATRGGTPRYPSWPWLEERAGKFDGLRIAVHLCGSHARAVIDGDAILRIYDYPVEFQRVQINAFVPNADGLLKVAEAHDDVEFIIQAKKRSDLELAASIAGQLPSASLLYDPSGGTGTPIVAAALPAIVETTRPGFHRGPTGAPRSRPDYTIPQPPKGVRMGYAGGIKPENVLEVLRLLDGRSDFWIDMESGVRDANDKLDLARVEAVLLACEGFIQADRPTA